MNSVNTVCVELCFLDDTSVDTRTTDTDTGLDTGLDAPWKPNDFALDPSWKPTPTPLSKVFPIPKERKKPPAGKLDYDTSEV